MVRKMTLCGLLVYLPSTSRAAAAVLVCIFALVIKLYTTIQKLLFVLVESECLYVDGL